MAANLDLTGDTIASTFDQLLHIGHESLIEADATAHFIANGTGTQSALSISTTRVGIGTEAPVTALNVHSAGGGECTLSSTDATLVNGEILGSLYFGGTDSAFANGAYIQAIASAEWDTSGDPHDAPTKLNFHTQSDGGTDNLATPRMTILDTGNTGIGTDTPSATFHVKNASAHDTIGNTGARLMNFGTNITDPLFALQIDASDGDLHIIGIDSSTWYDFLDFDRSARTVTGDVVDTSDISLKKDIKDSNLGLSVINQLKSRSFEWKTGDQGTRVGFIAQEIQEVLPEAAHGEDGSMGVKTNAIVSVLVKAVQELSAKVTALENA